MGQELPFHPAGKQVWRSAPVHPAVGGGALPLTYTVLPAREASLELVLGWRPHIPLPVPHSSCCSERIRTLFLCTVHFGFAPGAQFSAHHCPACTAHAPPVSVFTEVTVSAFGDEDTLGSLSKVCQRACPGIQMRSGSYSCLNRPKNSLC